MKHDDLTIILQGPTSTRNGLGLAHGIRRICDYTKYTDNVIISTWEKPRIKPTKSFLRENGIVYIEDDINKYQDWHGHMNSTYQIITTLNGLRQVKTKFVIKARTDEYYTDLSKFIKVMKNEPEKMTTSNFFFVKDYKEKFHPSDHVIGGLTKNILAGFEVAKDRCQAKDRDDLIYSPINDRISGCISPEALIFTSFLKGKGIEVDYSKSKEITKANANVVDVMDMGEFFLCWGSNRTTHKNYEQVKSQYLKADIRTMDEL